MKFKELIRLLEQNGWRKIRQSGGHIVFGHPEKKTRLVIPYHSRKEVKKGLLMAILKEAEIKSRKR